MSLEKSLSFGILIGPKSVFCFTLIACKFEIYAAHTAARCCNKQQTLRAQLYTSLLIPCAHGKLNVKQHRTTPKPETLVSQQEEAALAFAGGWLRARK